MNRGNILVVDDEPDIRRLVQEILEDEDYRVYTAENAESARRSYTQHHPDLVLLDIWMPDTDGISLLKEWMESGQDTAPVVMMSGHGNVETAVEATRMGAYDFIEKPVSMGKLLVTVDHAIQNARMRHEDRNLRDQLGPPAVLTGKSQVIRELRQSLAELARKEVPVLIVGEVGSGRGVAARYLHEQGPRQHGPFIEWDLASDVGADSAARLTGREREGKVLPGYLDQAKGGTLYLNDIGHLDEPAQATLCDILQNNRYTRAGGSTANELMTRIIVSGDTELESEVADRLFSAELYRLLKDNIVNMPALREHREDIPDLVGHFVDWLTERENLPYRVFPISALNKLRNHYWPGNVRELRGVVHRILTENRGTEVGLDELDELLQQNERKSGLQNTGTIFSLPLRDARDAFEKAYLEHHLERTGGNMSELAQIVGMERTHLYRKIKQLGIKPGQHKHTSAE